MIDLGTNIRGVEKCASLLTVALNERFSCTSDVWDVVLIERQPQHRSIMMVAIQMFLCEYFSVLKAAKRVGRVEFVSAKNKLELCQDFNVGDMNKSKRYSHNKKVAVITTRRFLEEVVKDYGNVMIFDMHSKKDDLSDALLQAVSHVFKFKIP